MDSNSKPSAIWWHITQILISVSIAFGVLLVTYFLSLPIAIGIVSAVVASFRYVLSLLLPHIVDKLADVRKNSSVIDPGFANQVDLRFTSLEVDRENILSRINGIEQRIVRIEVALDYSDIDALFGVLQTMVAVRDELSQHIIILDDDVYSQIQELIHEGNNFNDLLKIKYENKD